MAITTSNSTSVKPDERRAVVITLKSNLAVIAKVVSKDCRNTRHPGRETQRLEELRPKIRLRY
jgi:hypothetical protein